LRLIDFVSLNLRLKDLLGPVTRVKKKKKKKETRTAPTPPAYSQPASQSGASQAGR